jgi:hypothetical protein
LSDVECSTNSIEVNKLLENNHILENHAAFKEILKYEDDIMGHTNKKNQKR